MTNFITKRGFDELKEEYEERMKKRKEIAKNIKIAKEQGDLSENAEYSAAKGQQAENERRLNWLKNTIKKSQVVESGDKEKVSVGCFVDLKKASNGSTVSFQIVGTHETNPVLGKISCESPIGKALFGKKVGDKIEVEIPQGKEEYLLKKIS